MDIAITSHRLANASKQQIAISNALIILFLSLISVLSINQYQYGTYDHEISVPFLKKFADSSLYPNDFLIAEIPYFYTYFWPAMALIINTFNIEIPTLFFAGYFICIYATFLAMYMLAMELFNKKEVAYLSMLFLLFSVPTLGETHTLESMFITRTVVLPVLLFAIYLFLKERYLFSFLLQGISFIIHPLSTVYVCGMLFIAALFTIKHIGIKRLLQGIGIVILCASPVLIWKALYPAPSLKFFHADPEWLNLLKLRSAHHVFPFSWPLFHFIQAILFLTGFVSTWKNKPQDRKQRVVEGATLAVVLMCVAGIVFTELFPLSIVVQFQLFRSFPFITYIAFIYFANYFLKEIGSKSNIWKVAFIGMLFISIYFGIYIWKFAGVLAVILTFFLISYYLTLYRNTETNFSLATMLALILVVGASGLYMRGGFSIANRQDKPWIAVQQWAKTNTALNDVFVVPPHVTGFRVQGDRAIYGDWKDGTQMFFNPSFGYEWIRRMKMLGYKDGVHIRDSYNSLDEAAFINVAREVKKNNNQVYIVTEKARSPLTFPVVYDNGKFTVYKASL
jgi:hypothetical protein